MNSASSRELTLQLQQLREFEKMNLLQKEEMALMNNNPFKLNFKLNS